jgi:esterase
MELNYKTFGEGEPLIILHGLFGMLDNWQTLARRFAEDFQVYIVDQRNHGKSPHDPVMDYPSMAEDLFDFMLDHDIISANIMGHSMGGKTVMEFAHLHPEKVKKLIVVDMAPKAYESGHRPIFEALYMVDLNLVEDREDAENMLAQGIESDSIRLFLLKNLKRKKGGGYEWKMNLDAIFRHYPDILSAINSEIPFVNPSLFIRGAKSNYILDSDFELIHEQFTEADIVTIDNAGHWVHADAPEELLQLVRNFIKK